MLAWDTNYSILKLLCSSYTQSFNTKINEKKAPYLKNVEKGQRGIGCFFPKKFNGQTPIQVAAPIGESESIAGLTPIQIASTIKESESIEVLTPIQLAAPIRQSEKK